MDTRLTGARWLRGGQAQIELRFRGPASLQRHKTFVPIDDAEPDQVYLASVAGRRSRLIAGFIHAAQVTLASSGLSVDHVGPTS